MADLHQRLLAELHAERYDSPTEMRLAATLGALVELHAPEFFGGHIACLACSPGMPPPVLVLWRDCSTIQAIADQLGLTEGA